MWPWLSDLYNEWTLAFIGVGLAVAAGAGWSVFKFAHRRSTLVTAGVENRSAQAAERDLNTAMPFANNTWVLQNDSPTVFIFVHGILSSSQACWFNRKSQTYWPSLVAADPKLSAPSVFVSGYTADLGSGIIDTYDAANEVMLHLRDGGQGAPLRKPRFVFVCHSQGGIVVMRMLLLHFEKFRDKQIGLILCGSPSWGSVWATLLTPVSLLLRFRQLSALKWGGSHVVQLDREFGMLLTSEPKRIPRLDGMCLLETRGALRLPKFVSEASASRYFGWHRIPKMTHSMLVKPDRTGHLSHKYLVEWVRDRKFVEVADADSEGSEHIDSATEPLQLLSAHRQSPVVARQLGLKSAGGNSLCIAYDPLIRLTRGTGALQLRFKLEGEPSGDGCAIFALRQARSGWSRTTQSERCNEWNLTLEREAEPYELSLAVVGDLPPTGNLRITVIDESGRRTEKLELLEPTRRTVDRIIR